MEDTDDLVYHVNLCGICQDSENLNLITTSMISENYTEHGRTYLDILQYIFPDIKWIFNKNIIPLMCKICLETIKEIADFKKLCVDMNYRRAFHKYPNISLTEKIKIEIIPDGIEEAMMERECNGSHSTETLQNEEDTSSERLSCNESVSSETIYAKEETIEHFNCNEEEMELETANEGQPTTQTVSVDANSHYGEEMEEEKIVHNDANEVQNEVKDDIVAESDSQFIDEKYKRSIYLPKYIPFKNERQCKECAEKFNSWKELKTHVDEKHVILRKYRCDICNFGFMGRDALYRHMYKHNGTRNYVCLICGGKYITRGDLNEHEKFHEDVPKHKCEKCGAKFKSISNLKTHAIVHTDPKDYKFLCMMCGNKYSTSRALSDHILHRHNTRSISCTMCNKKFYAKKDLTHHLLSHSDQLTFSCNLCEAKFKRKNILSLHMKKEHGFGNYKFNAENKFTCNHCDMKFASTGKLVRHIRTHTGARPFKCRLCNVNFICKYYIRSHLKQKHDIDVDADDFDTKSYYVTVNREENLEKEKSE